MEAVSEGALAPYVCRVPAMEDSVLVLDMVSEAGLLAHVGVLGATASSLPRGKSVRGIGSGNLSFPDPAYSP